ncbi:hypothetical protein M9435_001783 [Picochlorum sp. BPE23]|nr:hypothetical protein M9435_001783 [Picochlorum sp. BPE23]
MSYRHRSREGEWSRDGTPSSSGRAQSPGRRRTRRRGDQDIGHGNGDENEKRRRMERSRVGRPDTMHDDRIVSEPTRSILITNIPKNVKLYELEALFSSVPGTMAMALLNSKYGGVVGEEEDTAVEAAFLLMTGRDTATALMESDWKHSAYCRDAKMTLEFAEFSLECSMKARVVPTRVWICASCRSDNAPKRDTCFSCGMLRCIGCELVDPLVPTKSLRISNIDGDVPEGELEARIKSIAGVHSIRVLRDKSTGRPTGFAYCNCFSVDDAILIRESLHDSPHGHHGQLLQVEFCPERNHTKRSSSSFGGATNTKTPENVPSVDWEPAEFQHDDVATNAGGPLSSDTRDSGFVYDAVSGYMKEVSSGLYYDVHSGYYFDPITQAWGTKDPITNAFVPYVDDNKGATTSDVVAKQRVSSRIETDTHNVEADRDQKASETAKVKGKGAVIGAAPQISVTTKQQSIVSSHQETHNEDTPKKAKGIIHKGTWAKKRQ